LTPKPIEMDSNLIQIRKASHKSDWEEIRRICCETGNYGSPIDPVRWPFFAEHWIGPYQSLLHDWTWVAESKGRVAGYLTGCPNTALFEKKKLVRFNLKTALSIALGKYRYNSDVKRFLKRALHLSQGPEQCFTRKIKKMLIEQFPSHLHINLDSSIRGCGAGRALCTHFFKSLKEKQIPGIHVFCGPDPLGFYEQLGFRELGQVEFRPGVKVYAMGYSFDVASQGASLK
ncbi:MAG: GNAT family N-acetyltransferase, partial [Bdellovibrionota bacterium]